MLPVFSRLLSGPKVFARDSALKTSGKSYQLGGKKIPRISSLDEANDPAMWWKTTDHLLTIGVAGVTPQHLNSLGEMLVHHKRVKIKLASDKLNTEEVVHSILTSENLRGKVRVLDQKGRCIGFEVCGE